MTARILAAACVVDAVLGDPSGFPHPVRAIGRACTLAEGLARSYARGDETKEMVAGAVACATIVTCAYVLPARTIAIAYAADRRLGIALEVGLAWTTLAARNLLDEAANVRVALAAGDLAAARIRVARIVGRDVQHLDDAEIARAAIETLAESACDGIVAPLLALAAGGVPLAFAFKAASTLDSLIGHIEPPHTFFGRASARLDDAACFLPARITACAIAACAPVVGGNTARALAVLRADGARHRSPNAGRPEAAIAGALGVRLGGPNAYGGVRRDAAYLGADLDVPSVGALRRAERLVAAVTLTITALLVASSATFARRSDARS